MKKYFLTHVGADTFIMLNANEHLTNRMCNSTVFSNKEDAGKDVSVFDYFNVSVTILNSNIPLDRRTREFKRLVNQYGYFSASFLPEIAKRAKKGFAQLPKPTWIK